MRTRTQGRPWIFPAIVFLVCVVLQYIVYTNLTVVSANYLLSFFLLFTYILLVLVNLGALLVLLKTLRWFSIPSYAQAPLLYQLYGGALLVFFGLFAFFAWKIPSLPENIVVRYTLRQHSALLGGAVLTEPYQLLVYLYIVLGIFCINVFLSMVTFDTNKVLAYLFLGALGFSELFVILTLYANFAMGKLI